MALLHMTFTSQVLEMNVDMDVILPENTEGLIGMDGKASDTYPTLYLLHGMSDDHTIWERRTSIERYASDKNLAVVMPTTDLGWYTNMHFGPRYWDFISDELPRVCRSFFPHMSRRREETFVAGLSMGGYGAIKCGLRASETFGWAAGLSSGLDIAEELDGHELGSAHYWTDIFGSADMFRGSFNDLFAAVDDLAASDKPRPHLFLWCGTEDFLYAHNLRFRDYAREKGLALTYEESPGDHSWECWDAKIQDVLGWLPLTKEAE